MNLNTIVNKKKETTMEHCRVIIILILSIKVNIVTQNFNLLFKSI